MNRCHPNQPGWLEQIKRAKTPEESTAIAMVLMASKASLRTKRRALRFAKLPE